MKQRLVELEKDLDNKVGTLPIWQNSFQTILSLLLLAIDTVDKSKGRDTAMDYSSRLSYIFKMVKSKAAKEDIVNSTNAILSLDPAHVEDINFLIAYAHFSMLMPQIHRGTLAPTKIEGNTIELDYTSSEVEFAELIDKLYSFISLQAAVSYNREDELYQHLYRKVTLNDTTFSVADAMWVQSMSEYYRQYVIVIEILPSAVLKEGIGFTYNEYLSFTATIRAFADYFLALGKAYYHQANSTKDETLANNLMSEYFEHLVCCLNFKFISFFMNVSGLSKEKLMKGLSYYLSIYSNNTKEKFVENSFCGEGFFPPFCLMDQSLIFSPHACRYMLNVNNALYSLNKRNTKLFDDKISQHLEPTLINQLEYLFTSLKGIKTAKNIKYEKSEIDLLVLSEQEQVCLVVQVKSTIAPDSSRTVDRVQGRALEGIDQINLFNTLSAEEKIQIIYAAFKTKLTEVSTVDLLVVRSSAGSDKIWSFNDKVRIANYTLLAWIISEMIEVNDYAILNFTQRIKRAQDELVRLSKWQKDYENLKIGDYTIRLPNLNIDMSEIVPINFRTYKNLPEFEKSHS
jgi:hypothetical protein